MPEVGDLQLLPYAGVIIGLDALRFREPRGAVLKLLEPLCDFLATGFRDYPVVMALALVRRAYPQGTSRN